MNGIKCKFCTMRCANGTGLSAHMRAAHKKKAAKKKAAKKKAAKKPAPKPRKQLRNVTAAPRRQPQAPRVPRLVQQPNTGTLLEEIVKTPSINSMTERLEKLRQEFLDKAAALGKILNDLADL